MTASTEARKEHNPFNLSRFGAYFFLPFAVIFATSFQGVASIARKEISDLDRDKPSLVEQYKKAALKEVAALEARKLPYEELTKAIAKQLEQGSGSVRVEAPLYVEVNREALNRSAQEIAERRFNHAHRDARLLFGGSQFSAIASAAATFSLVATLVTMPRRRDDQNAPDPQGPELTPSPPV